MTNCFALHFSSLHSTNNKKPTTVSSYSSSLLSDTNFIWVSGNNINDGRTGILTKNEYLTAGHYFDLRSSFPDLEYRAHDFRVYIDEKREYYGSDDDGAGSDGEVTVRFTTLVTGTFNGGTLQLRSKVMESNGRVMNCPPTSVSITFATDGSEKGKIIKLVTDMVSMNCSSILCSNCFFTYANISSYSNFNSFRSWTGRLATHTAIQVLLELP